MNLDELRDAVGTWRLRVQLTDHPGELAMLASRLSEQDCNLLGVAVLPVTSASPPAVDAGTVVDELVLRAPASMGSAELRDLVDGSGSRCIGIVAASVGDLVDAQTAALRAASSTISGIASVRNALGQVLSADSVSSVPDGDPWEVGVVCVDSDGHRARLALGGGEQVVAERGWAPFTDGELARVAALLDLLAAVERRRSLPAAVVSAVGSGLVLRIATRDDVDALVRMHRRCSAATLFARYHAGLGRLQRSWALRLLDPPAHAIIAAAGHEVVGFAQVIPAADGASCAELSLLVEDEWQRQGVGSALLAAAHELAHSHGISELLASCLPEQSGMQRAATRAGLGFSVARQPGLLEITIQIATAASAIAGTGEPIAVPPDAAEVTHPDSPSPRRPRRQLSPLDAQFLNAETGTTHTHVGALSILDPGATGADQVTLQTLRELVGGRLHLVDPLRWQLQQVPLGLDLPYWLDSGTVELTHHIREVHLPRPGTDDQLGELIARFSETPLDRTRPLWECHLVHGLEGGRQALYTKVHHALIDGVSGAEVLAVLFDLGPEPRQVPAPDSPPEAEQPPGAIEMLARGVRRVGTLPTRLARSAPTMLPHLLDLPGAATLPGAAVLDSLAGRAARLARREGPKSLPSRPSTPPRTPFNGPVTARRCFAFTSLPLEEVKTVKNALGMTVNDVVMALCTAALRRWLTDHDALPDGPLVAGMPVSVRTTEQIGTGGNQISFMLADLPTDVADPSARLLGLHTSLAGAKQRFRATPDRLLHAYCTVIPQTLHGIVTRTMLKAASLGSPPFNLLVSNVAGPQVPLYAAGARVTASFPVSVVSDIAGGLNITVMSYDGHLDFGVVACRDMVPEVWDMTAYLRDALTELLELAAPTAVPAPAALHPTRSLAPVG